ncbi:hypothetical protein OX90_28945, partial [Pseudomonas coronafaciens pv. porri]
SAIVDEQPKATMSVATDRNTPSDAPELIQPTSAEVVPEQSNETAQPDARSAQQQAPGEADPGSSANVDDQK